MPKKEKTQTNDEEKQTKKLEKGNPFFSKRFQLHGSILKAWVEDNPYSFTGKDGKPVEGVSHNLFVNVLDEDETAVIRLVDKDVSHAELYGRGMTGTFTLRMDFEPKFSVGKYDLTMNIADFKEDD